MEDDKLLADFGAVSARTLRVGVNSFMDSLGLVMECLEDLDFSGTKETHAIS